MIKKEKDRVGERMRKIEILEYPRSAVSKCLGGPSSRVESNSRWSRSRGIRINHSYDFGPLCTLCLISHYYYSILYSILYILLQLQFNLTILGMEYNVSVVRPWTEMWLTLLTLLYIFDPFSYTVILISLVMFHL